MILPDSVLITGAAGNLGSKLAAHLNGRTKLTLLDLVETPAISPANLSQWNSWTEHFHDAHAVVHLAGDPVAYHAWEEIMNPNIDAMLNVYEAAATFGVSRVIFASSNHVMGGYQHVPQVPITEELPPLPGLQYFADGQERFSGPYACAKLLGERVGRHYALTRGIEVIAVRLGWVWRGHNVPSELPIERGDWFRQMWLSDRDFLHLMDCCLTARLPEPFIVVNGMSANSGMRWDLTTARRVLGYHPVDDVNNFTETCR